MIRDPLAKEPADFPYETLARVGITPQSTLLEVREASFELMAKGGMSADERRAWEVLRKLRRRLQVDFLIYRLDFETELVAARTTLEEAIRRWGEDADVTELLAIAASDLKAMEGDQRPLHAQPVAVLWPWDEARYSPWTKVGESVGSNPGPATPGPRL